MAKYESVESFASRFCELNKISVKQFFDYISATIDGVWRQGWGLLDEETAKISAALQEPLAIVDSILSPYEGDADALAKYCGDEKNQDQIQYCPSCASEGYHSHFHTLSWLERCPFDGTELMTHSCYVGTDVSANRIGALTQILRAQWPGWPGGVPDSAGKRRHLSPLFLSFQRWVLDTNMLARNLTEMRFAPRGNVYWVAPPSCAHRVNQIRSLLPPPEEVIRYFSKAAAVSPNLAQLGAQTTSATRDLLSKYDFHELTWFYRIRRNSDPAGSAARAALDSDLAALRSRHAICSCRWGHSRNEGWRSVHPDEWPHWDLKCPYEIACTFLEAHYGDFRYGQSGRAADIEFFRYIECAEKFANVGMVGQFRAPEDRFSEVVQRCVRSWEPWLEWTGPLAELFDAVLDAGRISDATWLHRWLRDVDSGAAPQASPFLYPGVGLIDHAGGLAILSWHDAGRD